MPFRYPPTPAHEDFDTLHGTRVDDPFRWLEDGTSAAVKAWARAQSDLTRGVLDALSERAALASRLRELLYVEVTSAPVARRGRIFFRKRSPDREKAVVCWRERADTGARVLLDPNTWSDDGSDSLGTWSVSRDGSTVAYQVKRNNSDEATLYVKKVVSGDISAIDVIEGAKYAVPSWTPDGNGFYYTRVPPAGAVPVDERPGHAAVYFHRLGEPPEGDTLVYPATGDPSTFVNAALSADGHWLVVTVQHGWASTDAYVCDVRATAFGPPAFIELAVGRGAHLHVECHQDSFYVTTDENAPRSRVFRAEPGRLERSSWREIVAERPDATLADTTLVGGRLLLHYLKDAASELVVCETDGRVVRDVPLGGVGSVVGLAGEPDDDLAYYSYESFTTPHTIYEMSVATGVTTVFAAARYPVDPSGYVVERLAYPSGDGTPCSLFLVRPRDFPRDGSRRALLYGYGGFQIAQTPAFAATAFPWLERGGAFVVAHLRGGGEFGEAWHRDGTRERKQNTFDDFIAAAEFLVREGYTAPDRLVVRGGSNGGLLVGAVITQRPDLFAAAVCAVPLLDMVRYHQFGSGRTWVSEYGSTEDAALFPSIYAYSPYHHVRAGVAYPATLLLSADADDRVDPLHARKFAAMLQSRSCGGPALLRVQPNAGHGGADLLRAAVDEAADALAFSFAFTASGRSADP